MWGFFTAHLMKWYFHVLLLTLWRNHCVLVEAFVLRRDRGGEVGGVYLATRPCVL